MQTRNKHNTINKIERNNKKMRLQKEGKEKRSTLFSRHKTKQKNANSTKTTEEISKLRVSKRFFMCWKGKIRGKGLKRDREEKVTVLKKKWMRTLYK